jgi:hypothetical protein
MNDNKGGGVAIIYKTHVDIRTVRSKLTFVSFEHMITTITTKDKLFRIVNVYRPDYSQKHRITPNMFFEEFIKLLDDIVLLPGILILTGDFNFHLESVEDHYALRLLDILAEYSLYQLVSEPTHENGGTIDLVVTSDKASVQELSVCKDCIGSDHNPIHFKLVCQLKPTGNIKETWIRDFRTLNLEAFKEDLRKSPEVFNPSGDMDYSVDCYEKILTNLLNKYCPLKYIKFKKKPNSLWYNQDLRNLKTEKRRLERKFIKSKDAADQENYRNIKRRYNWKIQDVRKSYYKKCLDESKGDIRKLNKIINKLSGRDISFTLPRHGTDKEIAENMSIFFDQKIRSIREKISAETATLPNIEQTPANDIPSLDAFNIINESDLKSIIDGMNTKFCSLDPVPTWLVKSCFEELKHLLIHIVNKSLHEENKFPSKHKHATIKPAIKDMDGDTEEYNNYRPISNTSFIAKLLEKTALIQLDTHVKTHNLHAENQSGYREKHSCETAMVKIINDMNYMIENGNMVALILLDLSAAFDTVDHEILTTRLRTDFGLTSQVLKWIVSYLTNRSFSVNIRKEHSNRQCLNYGVPQGSLLGPILFIMYTKDINEIANKHKLSIHMYADDTQLYIGFQAIDPTNVAITERTIHACLEEIKLWMNQNFLKINAGKTKFIIIGSPYQVRNHQGNAITLINDEDGKELEKLHTVLSLGVTIDSTLSMKNFVNTKCSEAYFKLKNISRLRYYLDTSMRIMLVRNLILSKLDYCNAILANIPKYMINKLQRVLNASVRFIYDIKKHEHISYYVKKAHFLPVRKRVDFKLCTLVFKIIHKLAPTYLNNLVKLHIPSRDLRVGRDSIMVEANKQSKTISSKMVEVWNQLPKHIRSANDIITFKKTLKTTYFKEEYNE